MRLACRGGTAAGAPRFRLPQTDSDLIRTHRSPRIARSALLLTLPIALAACGRVAGDHAALTPASGKRADGSRGMVVASQVDAAAAGAE
ncbi:MAG: hypothetical protein ACKOFO_10540, partial [Gemmatimonadota bacterium]